LLLIYKYIHTNIHTRAEIYRIFWNISRDFFKICNAAAYIPKRVIWQFFHGNRGCQICCTGKRHGNDRLICLCLYWHQQARDGTITGGWVGLYLLNYVDQTAVHGTQMLVR